MVEMQEDHRIFAVEVNNDAVVVLKNEFPDVNFISSIEELPKHYDENGEEIEPNINDFWKITILFVKSEWVPEWWQFD